MQTTVPLVLIVLGAGLLGLGILKFFAQRRKIRQLIKVEGTVTDLIPVRVENTFLITKTESGKKLEPKYRYRSQVRFKTATGKKMNFLSPISYRPARHQVGERVEVLYDARKPADAIINGFWELWLFTLMLVFWGVFALGMGGLAWLLLNQKI